MTYETILYTSADGIARVTLNRPDRLNSFTAQMHEELRDALAKVAADASTRVLLLTGAGRGFCAGQDLSDRAVAPGEHSERRLHQRMIEPFLLRPRLRALAN